METYWGTPAEEISFADFWRFALRQRRELMRFLSWVGRME
jgi:hypothetical protein